MHHRDLAIAHGELKLIVEEAQRVCRAASVYKCSKPHLIVESGSWNAGKYAAAIEAMCALRWAIITDAPGFWAGLRKRQDAT